MNLIIDIGNSSTKIAVYHNRKIKFSSRITDLSCKELETWLTGNKIRNTIISSVKELPDFIIDLLTLNKSFVHILTHKSEIPFRIEYATPETLGADRIAALAGGCLYVKNGNLLVIDAGTAITYDYLIEGKFSGGNISPGIDLRFRALNQFTAKLPLVKKNSEYTSPGQNTSDAIMAGVINGVVYEINQYIRTFKKEQRNAKVIFTGGDSVFLKDRLAQKVKYMPDLVTDGLNYILEYNAK
jgi:type III pantothenate kinase